jgi:hypothetical protein
VLLNCTYFVAEHHLSPALQTLKPSKILTEVGLIMYREVGSAVRAHASKIGSAINITIVIIIISPIIIYPLLYGLEFSAGRYLRSTVL